MMTHTDGAVEEFNRFIHKNSDKINGWLKDRETKDVPIYSSVDIRNARFKIAPVDINLFPSGFNNLSQEALKIATACFSHFFKKNFTNITKIAVIAENFTKNIKYWEHIKAILKVLLNTKLEVRLIALHNELSEAIKEVEVLKLKNRGIF